MIKREIVKQMKKIKIRKKKTSNKIKRKKQKKTRFFIQCKVMNRGNKIRKETKMMKVPKNKTILRWNINKTLINSKIS